MLSQVLKNIKSPATLKTALRVRELKAQGKDVISLCIGEPDFSTPPLGQEMAIQAIKDCDDSYPPVSGTNLLREEIVKKFARDNALKYSVDDIIVSNGAKQVLYNVLSALLNPGDEVILIAPYWVSYSEMVRLASATPVVVSSTEDFRIDFEALESALNEKTKAIILNSPNNPSGVCYTESELRKLADVLRMYPQVYIVSDDIYEHITYSHSSFLNIANVAPDLRQRIVIVNGASKCYAMTGWRIGYAAITDKELMSLVRVLQEHSTGGACTIAQAAAVGALRSGPELLRERLHVFESRRDKAFAILSSAPYLKCSKPDGAFYLFICCKDLLGKKTSTGLEIKTDSDLTEYLLNEHSVAVVSGSEFGVAGYFRISYALSIELLEQACKRIIAALDLLK
ncbi:degT/DnrJ/EryC1/StrS aminotransferase family protein [Neorickettsia helminthoeca str. Oregon]|uniref:Aminotransferase n=1 Tax=Neorickettsia helminthoeca str. Oregon TaxID=1286528 RepID=X5GX75_9RICK|nr:pyridoxal phosphate-dependent aminotransferase [Neorickettsia helminthoeca]AHX11652.1 degT/DnrJ/EryC1/StrS aminotransferase family protein [Neorickettsia helminthoeca str. Oregon]